MNLFGRWKASLPLFLLFMAFTFSAAGSDNNFSKIPGPFGLYRGVNLGNALDAPKEGQWGIVLKEEYFQLIKNAGFDFVRIPIRWSAHAEMEQPYTINPEFFKRTDWAVNQALSRHLSVIINIHHYIELSQNPQANKARFLAIWRQIANHYRSYPENLYFEVLNEPTWNLDSKLWNDYLREAIQIIRKTNPGRIIIAGPARWNSIPALENLLLPEDDRNIIVTFHYYQPFHFTHQGAGWVKGSEPWLGTKWLGTGSEKGAVRKDIDTAVKWAETHNRALLLGEFGAYSKADMNSRARWTSFVAREAEKRNIAWAYWEFCAGFGIYDPDANKWRTELLKALIPQK
ncbi:MAG: glycoside hydrolase family 5 protein [Firmicutes bacterium]|nr:glycoside hydrolase family 5 protein [Bacillota bacterium]